VSSSIFVGRGVELAELDAALTETAAGRPSLVVIAGDSGVGKTRLLSELAVRAGAAGARVLGGDCLELGDGELPCAPSVGALRSLVRAGDPVLEQLPPSLRPELATLLPELGSAALATQPGDPRGAGPRV
jgi:predicted ATPase